MAEAWYRYGICGLGFIFWLWMLIAIIKRPEFPNKILWFLVVLLLSFLGAVIYYFAEHRAYRKPLKQQTMSSAAPQASEPTIPHDIENQIPSE